MTREELEKENRELLEKLAFIGQVAFDANDNVDRHSTPLLGHRLVRKIIAQLRADYDGLHSDIKRLEEAGVDAESMIQGMRDRQYELDAMIIALEDTLGERYKL